MVRRAVFNRGRVRRSGLVLIGLLVCVLVSVGVADAKSKPENKQAKAAKIVVPAQTETVRFPFDEDRGSESRSFTLEARPPLGKARKVDVELGGDLLDEDGRAFPEDQIDVTVERSTFGNVKATMKLDPDDVEPGEYTGTLTVAGKRIEPGAVTVSATLRDAKSKAIVWALLGFFIGLLVKVAGDFSRMKPGPIETAAARLLDEHTHDAKLARTATTAEAVAASNVGQAAEGKRPFKAKEYFWSGSFASSLLLGLLGAGTAYALAYLSNDTWGADSLDNWKVAAAAFAGVLTGVSGADLVKPFRPTTTNT
jgi:hypothetical protein